MAAPIYGEPPKIRQEGASLVVYDNGSWFTQDGGRATRFVHVWFWNGANIWATPAPPWRTEVTVTQPGENQARIPLGPTNVGGVFWVVEYGGIDGTVDAGKTWTEWGREWSGNREDVSRWGARSLPVTVAAWETPPTPPPPPDDLEVLLKNARDGVRPLIAHLRAEGLTWAQVKAHPYGHAYYNDLGGR